MSMDEKRHYSDELQDLLSGQISSQQRAVIEQHLTGCSRCRQEFEELRWSIQRLTGLRPPDVPHELREKMYQLLKKEDRKSRTRRILSYAAVVILIIIGALYVFIRPDFASEVAKDFQAFRSGGLALEFQTDDEGKMEAYFTANGIQFPTRVFDLAMMKYDLVGGRVHHLAGRSSALFVYRSEGNKLLLCQMYLGTETDLPKNAALHKHNGIPFYVYTRNGITTVFWPEGDVFCVLASDISADEVIALAFAKAMLPAAKTAGAHGGAPELTDSF